MKELYNKKIETEFNKLQTKADNNIEITEEDIEKAKIVLNNIIIIKKNKGLSNEYIKNIEDRFAKLVHHPWTKENPFFTKAVNNQRSKILERFNTIIQEYIND